MDLDLALKLADLDLADAGLDTSLIFDAYNAQESVTPARGVDVQQTDIQIGIALVMSAVFIKKLPT